MTDKEKIDILKTCFTETIWMAIRYAHGRQTFAPDTVRQSVRNFQKVFPDWKPRRDITLDWCCGSEELITQGKCHEADYLFDLFR